MNPIELGKFIAQLRSDKELTQEELAEKLYIDKRKVSRWECGTSIPEFDMLIKLSEIFDVSLYEFSICKKITDEKISKKMLNKFKSITDLKTYKIKKLIIMFFIIILLVFFISTTIYTFKNNNTVEIYELKSLDEDFYIEGNFIKFKSNYTFNIVELYSEKYTINNCQTEVYSNNKRISSITNNDKLDIDNRLQFYDKYNNLEMDNHQLTAKLFCNNNGSTNNYSFNFKINKIYDNSFF